jgi:Domain of unknown function (DUF4390)
MTASTTPYYKNALSPSLEHPTVLCRSARARRVDGRETPHVLRLLLGVAWCFLLLVRAACAGELDVVSAGLSAEDDAYVLNADFRAELTARLEDVVSRGVPLYFVVEFELTRPRWYWFDEVLANKSRTFRLSYHALTRQYRLSTGVLYQNFDSLEEALAILARIRDWAVADKGALKNGATYDAQLRLRLDLTQLPKPLQVTAIGSREWNLSTDWYRFTYTPGLAERETK